MRYLFVPIVLLLISSVLAAQDATYEDPRYDSSTINLGIYVLLGIGLVGVYLLALKRFRHQLEKNPPQKPREAYHGFLFGLLTYLLLATVIVVLINIFSVKRLFIN